MDDINYESQPAIAMTQWREGRVLSADDVKMIASLLIWARMGTVGRTAARSAPTLQERDKAGRDRQAVRHLARISL